MFRRMTGWTTSPNLRVVGSIPTVVLRMAWRSGSASGSRKACSSPDLWSSKPCGCSSVVERWSASPDVEGANPFSRFHCRLIVNCPAVTRVFLVRIQAVESLAPWCRQVNTSGSQPEDRRCESGRRHSPLAQQSERPVVNRRVMGAIPIR